MTKERLAALGFVLLGFVGLATIIFLYVVALDAFDIGPVAAFVLTIYSGGALVVGFVTVAALIVVIKG